MLSTAYVAKGSVGDATTFLMVALLLLVLDIALMVYAFYSLLECVHHDTLAVPLAVFLGILMFIPGTGFLVQIGVIIYHSAYCKTRSAVASPSFTFY